MKQKLKEKAVKLRKQGFTYSEILKEVPVARSTLSLWLRSVGLAEKQQQRLTEKKLAAARRGSEALKKQRIEKTAEIHRRAIKEVGSISKRELWLIGVMLYWAEGTKEKEWNPGIGAEFVNSDADMIKVFLRWLREICGINEKEIKFKIYIHENNKYRLDEVKKYWSQTTGFSKEHFSTVYLKKHTPKTRRRNIGESYYGVLDIKVKASSTLNRQIAGWTKGVVSFLENN